MESQYNYHEIHFLLLNDRVRCETFRRALAKCVKPGDVVLDVGAGTGILSLFAVQAGARKVYAVERARIVELTRQLLTVNGAEERVKIVRGDMATVRLPEKVDVIVSEWMGGYGVDEGFLPAVILARDRWLKPKGKMLPECVSAWVAPVWDKELAKELSFWRSRPYDVDLSLLEQLTADEDRYCQHHITGNTLLAEAQQMWTTDVYTCSVAEARSRFSASLSFATTRGGRFNALATWFRAEFGHGIVLTTAPDAPITHWGRTVHPLNRTVKVKQGAEVLVEFVCEPTKDSHCQSKWSVKVEGGAWEHHPSIN